MVLPDLPRLIVHEKRAEKHNRQYTPDLYSYPFFRGWITVYSNQLHNFAPKMVGYIELDEGWLSKPDPVSVIEVADNGLNIISSMQSSSRITFGALNLNESG